jgi:hypothetical protein
MPAPTDLDELIRTHAKLRDIMVLASARIKRQALGHQDYELLKSMREALIEGRTVAREFDKRRSTPKQKGRQPEEES